MKKVKRSDRIQLVVDLALAAETQAAKNLSIAQNELVSEQRRLDDINDYYKSYEVEFSKKLKNLRSSDLANSRAFLSNLDQARQAQAFQIKHSEQKVDLAKNQWRESHLKTDALATYHQQISDQEQLVEEQKEQKFIDDIVNLRLNR